MKRIIILLGIIVLLNSGCANKNIESSYKGAEKYSEYLKQVDDKSNNIDLYYSKTEENNYYIQIKNNSSYFFKGNLDIYDDNNEKLDSYKTKLIAPNNSETNTINLTGLLYSFTVNKYKFYEFNYPNIEYDYVTYNDTINEEAIVDIIIGEQSKLDDVKIVAQYEYAKSVITDQYPVNLYFYDNNLEYYESETGDDYPNPDTALYKAKLDFDNKNITIMILESSEWIEKESIDMP